MVEAFVCEAAPFEDVTVGTTAPLPFVSPLLVATSNEPNAGAALTGLSAAAACEVTDDVVAGLRSADSVEVLVAVFVEVVAVAPLEVVVSALAALEVEATLVEAALEAAAGMVVANVLSLLSERFIKFCL